MLYSFGEFLLCPEEKVLWQGDRQIPLTPKMYELLLAFLEKPGKVLEKHHLLRTVWPDSFVEDGNISFNIRQLRKVFNDSAQAPSYIETLPRRGYRFVADVKRVHRDRVTNSHFETDTAGKTGKDLTPTPIISVYSFILIILAFAGATAIGAYFFNTTNTHSLSILAGDLSSEKLSTNGMVYGAAISPDGKTVVYSNRIGNKQSVWLRHLDSGTNTELLPPSEDEYYEFTFSPDGDAIYFTRGKNDKEHYVDVFRIPVHGGIPEMVLSATQSSVSISPDGETISFVRCPMQEQEWCSLYIADSRDGRNERKLTTKPFPIRIADNEVSPDGRSIVFAYGQSRNQANEFGIGEIDLETGNERIFSTENFFNVKNLAWLPDRSGLLLTASRMPNKHFRIWYLDASTGDARPLTKDSEAYSVLSLDSKAEKLVTTQIKQDFRIHIFDIGKSHRPRYLADGSRAYYASDGKVYYASMLSGNDEIWSVEADGTGQRQLTNDNAGDGHPVTSKDGGTVFFTSNRSGSAHVWRMDPDGSHVAQVTKNTGGSPVYFAADLNQLYYRNSIDKSLWSVSLETDEERMIFDGAKGHIIFSPDGTRIAYEERKDKVIFLHIVSSSTWQRIGKIELPKEKDRLLDAVWTPDGAALIYLMSDLNYKNNVIYFHRLDELQPRVLLDISDDEVNEVSGISVSPSGNSISIVLGGWRHDAILLSGIR